MRKFTKSLTLLLLCVFALNSNAQNFNQELNDHFEYYLEQNELLPQDVQWKITGQNVSQISGVNHIYFSQVIDGVQIYGTESSLHLLQNGTTLNSNNNFIKNSVDRITGSTTPSLTAIQAVLAAADQLNYNITETLYIVEGQEGADQRTIISNGGISLSNIPAKLMYHVTDNNELILAWDISIQEKAQTNWWSMRVDAVTGNILHQTNWMVSCSLEHDHSEDEILDYNKNLYDIPNYNDAMEKMEACNICYEVFALPLESPFYGARTTENDPSDATASPFGWHDTDGAPGAEFTVTTGNNVDAFDAGDNPGYRPDGGGTLDFTGYPFNEVYTGANQYEAASITNLFYWNNIIHDVLYQYGFDEVSGNFQENNYGNGGSGSDSVNANGQTSVWCNATFGTPPDGSNPTMSMYICGDKDGDFDDLVMIHEYGHGISNRLTGGPAASGCLGNQEQMGEGWSDWYGTVMTVLPGDLGTDARGVGTYLFGQGPGGPGIRTYPYSTDMGINPHTYDNIKTESVPHGVGSVWAAMLWEVYWGLVDEHGIDHDLYNFTGDVNQDAGNVMAFAIVTEGMKLQPCSPGFVDGRDAILAADLAIYGGANECVIWDAFAKRGLGLSADQGSSGSRSDGTEAFDIPSGVAAFTAPEDVCANSEILTGLGGGTPSGGEYSGPGVTDDGNGATYSFDPVVAGVGVHTITYEVPAGPCSVASAASDDIEVIAIPDGPTTTGVTDFCLGDDVTVTAVPLDPGNAIRWYDALIGGNFLFEGASYTFSPSESTDVFAQENPPGPLSQLVISEITLETPDRLEIQNVGIAKDYSGYAVAVSEQPYNDVNIMNTVTQILGAIGADSVVDFNDDGGAGYWGNNIWWDNDGTGWIIIIDDSGNVVDSVFWNFTAAQISGLNITINGFNVTAADLDWSGDGADFSNECFDSFRRNGDSNSLADWSGACEASDFGVYNSDIGLGFVGCLGERTLTSVTIDSIDPEITCPADVTEIINSGDLYTIPDYTPTATATDNCTASPVITQDPAAGTEVGAGVTVITLTATDAVGNDATCTFELTVEEILGANDLELYQNLILYPNPSNGEISIVNNSNEQLRKITIIDINGKIIQVIHINSNMISSFSLETYSTGMYFVKLDTENSSVMKRVIKI